MTAPRRLTGLSPGTGQRLAPAFAALVALALLAATFQLGFEKNLVRTIAPEEWGRYLFAISSAITKLKFDIGWFASSEYVEGALQQGGLTANPDHIKALGKTFPQNLKDPEILQSAIDKAWAVPYAPSNRPEAAGYYSGLRGAMGDDVGLSTYTVLAFVLFGRQISSLYFLYFAILTASMLLYLMSHGRNAAAMTVLALVMMVFYLVASSDMISFTRSISYRAGQSGLDFKDPRFLSTLAFLPIVHIVVWWLSPQRPFRAFDLAILACQAVILAFAIQVRSSTQWAVIGLGLVWLFAAVHARWRRHLPLAALREPTRSYSLVTVATCVFILGAGYLLPVLAAHPVYKLQGDRLSHPLWRSVYYGLQMNPDWMPKYGARADGVEGDDMPVVAVKKYIASLPADQQGQYLVRGYPTMQALEKFSRIMFLELLREDPGFVLETYLVFQRRIFIRMTYLFYGVLARSVATWQILALSGAMLGLVLLTFAERDTLRLLASLLPVAALFAVLAVLPNWIISVADILMVDHFCWSLILVVTSIALIGVALARLLVPGLSHSGRALAF
jgi:hypothetical protein